MSAAFRIVADHRRDAGRQPQVSLVVPVFNVEPYLAECLASIADNAGAIDLELIVIDDGSTDGSLALAHAFLQAERRLPAVLIQQANQGLSAVRNLGATLASGRYLGFLDSDDRLAAGALGSLLRLAEASGSDVVLGRTLVFDSASQATRPFYDAAIWQGLLSGRATRVTDARQSPRLLSLEPNVNYRLIRRTFYHEQALEFPRGLYFEDPPVHFGMLLGARRIALADRVYYHYRVNREGKITEARSLRRFDALRVAALALDALQARSVAPPQGGAALRVLLRMAWGCGVRTPPAARRAFFAEACGLFRSSVPGSWLAAYRRQQGWDPKHLLLAGLFASGSVNLLTRLAQLADGNRPGSLRGVVRRISGG